MKRVLLLLLLVLFVIAPLQAVTDLTQVSLDTGLSEDAPQGLNVDTEVPDSEPEGDFELDMMFFTETYSHEDGLYYVCRRGTDTVAYFGASVVMYLSGGTVFTIKFPHSNNIVPLGEQPTGSSTNYLYGIEHTDWKTDVKDYSVLRYPEIYPGIDLVYKIQDGSLKYEFMVRPYADPDVIQLDYVDADAIEIDDGKVLVVKGGHKMVDTDLRVFQKDTDLQVACHFTRDDMGYVGFTLGDYDQSMELIIDPVYLAYSTYLGGSSDELGYDVVVEDGYVYVTGWTTSSDFPLENANDTTLDGTYDCFVTKLAADGQSLVYSTYLGGTSSDYGQAIAVEAEQAYITGYTYSSDFPLINANDTTFNGGNDCFVTKLAADGQSLVYSTYLGGTSTDNGYSIAVEDGHAYVMVYTDSTDFTTYNAYDSTYNGGISDCFVTKFAVDGQSLIYSTYLGGSSNDFGEGIAVEDGHAYVTGSTRSTDFPMANANDSTYNGGPDDCFVTKFAADGQSLVYSTFLGGSSSDEGRGFAVEDGCVYVTGHTLSADFPVANAYNSTYGGDYDCFVTKFAADGQYLVYSTFLGGSSTESGYGIAVEDGNTYVTGYTESTDFTTFNAYDSTHNGGKDCFVTKLAADGQSLVYSTFLGGSSTDNGYSIAVEDGNTYVTGETFSTNFPTFNAYDSTHNGGVRECFISVICEEDSDSDGLTNWEEELMYGTNSYCVDSDNDNFLDKYEITFGSNAKDPLDYPTIPQAWYDEIYDDLDGNATLIQNLIMWSDGNASLLETVKQQLDENATLLQDVISWLDGNHSAIETLFTYVEGNATLLLETIDSLDGNATLIQQLSDWLDGNNTAIEDLYKQLQGNATLLMQTVNSLDENATLIDNLVTYIDGNATLLEYIVQQLESNATLLQQTIAWLDGNHTAIEQLYTYLEGNATLLMQTVIDLDENTTLIQDLLTWSDGNSTLIYNLLQNHKSNATLLQQVVLWLDGNHTAIETLLTYVEGNATLIQQTVAALGENEDQLTLVAALASDNKDWLQTLNSTAIGNITLIRGVLDELGVTVGDTDYDGLDDLDEIDYGTDILCMDTDCDNLNDAFEVKIGTNPLDDDSDADSYLDGVEVLAGTDPLDHTDYPGAPQDTTTDTTSPSSTTPHDSPLTALIIVIFGGIGIMSAIVILFALRRKQLSS